MRFKFGFYIFFIGLLLIPIFVFATTEVAANKAEVDKLNQQIADRQAKIKELEQTIADYKEKIVQKQSEAKSLKNQMSILDNRISQIQLEIDSTQITLDSLSLQIQSLKLTITDKEKTIERQKKISGELIRNLQREGNKSYIEVVAAYDNFSDFYNQVQYLQTLDSQLGQSLKDLRLTKVDLKSKQQEVEDNKKLYEDQKNKLQEQRRDLQEDVNFKQNLLQTTKSSEAVYSTMLENLKRQSQQIEGEISYYEKEVRKKLEEENKIKESTSAGQFSWPLASHYITATFHDPDYPFRNVFEHTGIDIRSGQGSAVKAAASGYVGRAKYCTKSSCYSYVMLIHNGGLATVYGHLSRIMVEEGDYVSVGEVIGLSGGTPGTVGAGPFVTGPHLHFEMRKDGIPVNPALYLGI